MKQIKVKFTVEVTEDSYFRYGETGEAEAVLEIPEEAINDGLLLSGLLVNLAPLAYRKYISLKAAEQEN